MFINELKPNQAVESIVLEITDKGEAKEFTNFRGKIRVANAKVKDATGQCTLTLWNDEADRYSNGQKIRIINGWCKEYRGDLQVSSGKYGKIDVLSGTGEAAEQKPPAPKLAKKKPAKKRAEGDEELEEELEPEDEIFPEAEKDPLLKYEEKWSKKGHIKEKT
jgi:replication factor A1